MGKKRKLVYKTASQISTARSIRHSRHYLAGSLLYCISKFFINLNGCTINLFGIVVIFISIWRKEVSYSWLKKPNDVNNFENWRMKMKNYIRWVPYKKSQAYIDRFYTHPYTKKLIYIFPQTAIMLAYTPQRNYTASKWYSHLAFICQFAMLWKKNNHVLCVTFSLTPFIYLMLLIH